VSAGEWWPLRPGPASVGGSGIIPAAPQNSEMEAMILWLRDGQHRLSMLPASFISRIFPGLRLGTVALGAGDLIDAAGLVFVGGGSPVLTAISYAVRNIAADWATLALTSSWSGRSWRAGRSDRRRQAMTIANCCPLI